MITQLDGKLRHYDDMQIKPSAAKDNDGSLVQLRLRLEMEHSKTKNVVA